jgi:hypothetical protein
MICAADDMRRHQRRHVVDLHQFHLVLRDWCARKHFRELSQREPSSKWDWNQTGLEVGSVDKRL